MFLSYSCVNKKQKWNHFLNKYVKWENKMYPYITNNKEEKSNVMKKQDHPLGTQ